MRSRAVLAERDDRVERGAVGACLVPRLLEPPRELGLGATDERLPAELLVHLVGDRGGAPERLQLAGLLHRAERLDRPARRDELDAARPQRLRVGERQVPRLDRDPPAREQLGERRHDVPRRPVERDAVDRARRLRVAKVRVERRLACRVDEHGRVRAREAGQVAHVDEARDEQRVVELPGESLDSRHVSLRAARSSSARR